MPQQLPEGCKNVPSSRSAEEESETEYDPLDIRVGKVDAEPVARIANLLPLPLKISPDLKTTCCRTCVDRFVGTGRRPPHRWYVGIELETNQKQVFGDKAIGPALQSCSD
jgi:hypothetical protein